MDREQLIEAIIEGLNEATYDGAFITLDNEHEVVESIANKIVLYLNP
jgi:hypothetical protein